MAKDSSMKQDSIPTHDRERGEHPHIVLIVDDNPDSCTFYEAFLRHAGYATLCAHDGAEAIDVVASGLPDLVTMDISMPGMDGISATRAIRSMPKWKGVHIVATTAHDLAPDEWRAAGFDGYLQKPLPPGMLLDYVTTALRKSVPLD